jgi:DNA-binding NarL/FixJ family response regulator
MSIRLVLADDHPLILDGLEQLFRLEPDFAVVARCITGREALAEVRLHQPDILVLDIRMPEMDGLEVVRTLAAESPEVRVVVLTAGLDEREVLEAMRLGVRGVVLKSMASQMLVRCLRKVHAGEQWLERRSAGMALDLLLQREAGMREVTSLLTPRELEIVRLVSAGLRNAELGARLNITEGTVKKHLHNIYEKLGVETRVELVRWADERGLL